MNPCSAHLPLNRIEVIRGGHSECPVPALPTASSRDVGWNGIALESYKNVPGGTLGEHEHPAHFLTLLTSGRVRYQWTIEGRAKSAEHTPGSVYILPAGTRDRLSWSGSTDRIVLALTPHFLAKASEETAHLADVELATRLDVRDRHINALILALHADLEDGSPAGPLYGESVGAALAHYLARRYAVRTARTGTNRGGIPAARLNRVLDFMRQNCTRITRLWELAQVAEMSPHHFCESFKQSTGLSPYQYALEQRVTQAKECLRNPDVTVSQVAEATGFADQSNFTKVFRRIVGMTPSRFRTG